MTSELIYTPETLPVDEITSDIGVWLPDEPPPLDDDTEPLTALDAANTPNVRGRLSNYLWQLRLGRFALEPVNGGRFVIAFTHGVSDSTLRQLRASLLTVASFDLRRVVVSVPREWLTVKPLEREAAPSPSFAIGDKVKGLTIRGVTVYGTVRTLADAMTVDIETTDGVRMWLWKADVQQVETFPVVQPVGEFHLPGGDPNGALTDSAYIAWMMAECRKRDYDPQTAANHYQRRAETAESILDEVRAAFGIVKGDDVVEAAKAAAESARAYQTALEEIAALQDEHLRAMQLAGMVKSHRQALQHVMHDQRLIGGTVLRAWFNMELAKSEGVK